MAPLRSTRSALNPRISLITTDGSPSPLAPLSIKSENHEMIEPLSTIQSASNSSSPYFTSLRRSTRSVTNSLPNPNPKTVDIVNTDEQLDEASGIATTPNKKKKQLNISKYEYKTLITPSPRKKQKRSHDNGNGNDNVNDTGSSKKRRTPTTVKVESVENNESPSSSSKTPRKKPLPQLFLDKPHPAPPKWEEQYKLIEHMRKGIIAPVDNMGCDRPRTVVNDDPKTLRFHMLISLMLSSQTKDPVTSAAVTNLHDNLPGGLTAKSLAEAPIEEIQQLINKVGFWRRKADYIKEASIHLLDKEDGDVPKTLEGLCELKGVGPKMAFLALQCAWDINAGIGVDVHVHRITNRLKWHKPPTTTPEGTRLNLQSWLPSNLHKSINPMLVGFGQVICLPVGPRCDLCLLGQKKLCPSRITNVDAKNRKQVLFTFKQEQEENIDEESRPKIEIGYDENQDIPQADLEAGLVRIKDEPSPEPESSANNTKGGSIKMERDIELDSVIQEPGMNKVDQVLEILDRVDGAKDVDGNPLDF
ncbi:uncharacterized protein L201_002348 [Kwoniella dendrophila CBS 6074]|uniref:Endonuclease III homolog n=1 Tax=Kwoniella dendrophila CBS 6074 TaxID=1295534 RepID=A0AAX4JRS9_9TREE